MNNKGVGGKGHQEEGNPREENEVTRRSTSRNSPVEMKERKEKL